jgi:hypothetical protein
MTIPIMIQCKLNGKNMVGNVIDIQDNSTEPGALLDAYPPKVGQSLTQPTTFAANQTWEVLPDPLHSSHSIIQNPATGNCIDINHNSIDRGALLDASPAKNEHNENQLWDFLPDPFGSGYFFIQNPQTGYVIEIEKGSSSSGASLVVNPRRLFNNNFQLWAGVEQSWLPAKFPALTLASAPPGFGSNNQYVLLAPNQSTNLTSVAVTIDIIEDLIADSFSIQINGNAPTPANGSGARWDAQWVQFALLMQNNALYLWNQAWHASGPDQRGDPLASKPETSAPMLTTLRNNTVPEGTRIVLKLTIDHSDDDFVTAVSGQVFNNRDPIGTPVSLSLIGQPTFNPGGPVQESDLAPWGALSVVVVGPPGGNTKFSAGMGTITVACNPAVTVSSQLKGPNPHGIQTAEQSNCHYGQVQQGPLKQIVQPFGVLSPKVMNIQGSSDFEVSGSGFFPNGQLTLSYVLLGGGSGASEDNSVRSTAAGDGTFSCRIEPPNYPGPEFALGTTVSFSVVVRDQHGNYAQAGCEVDGEGRIANFQRGQSGPGPWF